MDEEKFMTIIAFGILALLMAFFAFIIFPIRITTGTGEHIGYVTAVDKEGLFWKNYHVYFKTETESSQEDEYCVIRFDNELANKVKDEARNKTLVALKYKTFFSLNPSMCHASQITGIEAIKQ